VRWIAPEPRVIEKGSVLKMAKCGGFCPDEYLGYDGADDKYYYIGWICNPQPIQTCMGYDTRMHALGGDCNNCVDCISSRRKIVPLKGGKGDIQFMPRPHLRRGVYRKGVPHPKNPYYRCDDFCPGDKSHILMECTAAYPSPSTGKLLDVRLYLLGHLKFPGQALRLGWEIDPGSPPSHYCVQHLPTTWITSVKEEPGGHVIVIDHLGLFHVQTVA
jgi:hypothetical protein